MKKKKSPFLGTLVVAAAVIALGVYAYFGEFKKGEEVAAKKEQDAFVLQLQKDTLDRLELHRNSGVVVLERQGGVWKMIQPVTDTVDKPNVDMLIDSLVGEKSDEVVAEGEAIDWKTYGLDQPVTRLVARSGDQKTREVKIGSVKSFDGQLYARVNDEKRVLLVNSSWDAHLSKPVLDLRDKRLLRADEAVAYDKIAIQKGASTLVLEQKDGKWSFAKGGDKTLPVGDSQVSSYLEKIRALRAVDIASETRATDAAKYGFKGSLEARIELSRGGEKPFWIEISAKKPTAVDKSFPKEDDVSFRFASSSDSLVVFKIYKSSVDDVVKSATDFYDKLFPFRMNQADVSQVEIKSAAVSLKAQKSASSWVLADPGLQKELDTAKLEDVIGRLGRLEVLRFRGKARGKGLDPAKNEIALLDKDGKTVLRLNWGESYAEKGPDGTETKLIDVRTSVSDQTFSVGDSIINELPLKELLKEKAAASPAATAAKSSQDVGRTN